MAKPVHEWQRSKGEYTTEVNGFSLRVYFDDEPIVGEACWVWSAMRFLHPEDETDDRVLTLGGEATTKETAQRTAIKNAAAYEDRPDFRVIWAGLTEEQRERVRQKAQWEHMSLSAVLKEWPDLAASAGGRHG